MASAAAAAVSTSFLLTNSVSINKIDHSILKFKPSPPPRYKHFGTSEGPLTNANSTLQYTDATAVQHKKTISQKFPIMPFSARALEEKRARLGLVECMNHELLQPYPVLHEKQGDFYCTHQIHDHIETSDDFDRKSKGHTGIFGLQDVES
ncbi:hypothetical protein KIW84_051482 [Lathyrus oleraceus]|uniref:Uncharacterized protein n=1 Tax=Pisum sativum TaxID=3888 RepID=A0A9D4WK52_PEA|nr:hypothetical protein KIW84_051482 [Pisum sativum]